jgi:histidyl-tRNA synthetase
MMAADTMEALGIPRGQYVVKVNNRKVLDGIMEVVGIAGAENAARRLMVLRAIDKFDRLGESSVRQLLGKGREDESGDFTKGAELDPIQTEYIMGGFLNQPFVQLSKKSAIPSDAFELNATYRAGFTELDAIRDIVTEAGYESDRIKIDQTVVRGLEYYTGPVFECDLLMETKDEDGRPVRFGSVGGGGRYDDLVARFTGQQVLATGFSLGVSRLYSALKLVGKAEEATATAPVVVLVLDRDRLGDYQRMTSTLRNAGIRAEMYLGTSGMKAQMKYADRRAAPLVVIQGTDEKAKGEIQIKNLRLGAELARGIESREEYKEARLAQVSVKESELVTAVKEALRRK